jgi:hypothetical protein
MCVPRWQLIVSSTDDRTMQAITNILLFCKDFPSEVVDAIIRVVAAVEITDTTIEITDKTTIDNTTMDIIIITTTPETKIKIINNNHNNQKFQHCQS